MMNRRDTASRIRVLRRHLRDRARRREFFPGVELADPSWDMLLELEVSALERQRISVSSLCIAANCPPTTALRHLARLEKAGWVVRTADRADRRRHFIELSVHARQALAAWRRETSTAAPNDSESEREAGIRRLVGQLFDLVGPDDLA